ncbi:hypothetical protein [Yersinia ruckeri]|uniref:hypothetical protein n=1 Tax=Yersinia ruckeri TaxID=29486 RepID=UPI0009182B76|nr:hypothetical protein [Yersinia ruckeri]MCW6525017.1 hypothetical protein [Yersinia ruckeri]MCW6611766.1 hypothetical protein [Yersinia ruckeri]MCW6669687.1 hypothetical protein [Yersinia ruckeri]OJC26300.1 hypothetical protein AXW27_05800 [Yersinia ruckeri]OJC33844.1 hypothetical protein AXW29_06170 [Yersinia ruckeri]
MEKAKIFCQKPEARSQKPEARSQKPEARSQKPEARSQKPEARSQKPVFVEDYNVQKSDAEMYSFRGDEILYLKANNSDK